MTARLAAAPAAARDGGGSSALRSPKHRCRGFAVRRRSVGNPRPGSRVRAAEQAPAGDDRTAAVPAPVRIGPAPLDQLTVPAQQRRRTHRETPRRAPRQRSRERREDCPIHGPKPCSPRLPANDRQLMPEQEDLELFRALRSAQQHDQLKQPTERHVEERPNHARPPELGEGEGIEPPAKPTAQTANRVSEPHAPNLTTQRSGKLRTSLRALRVQKIRSRRKSETFASASEFLHPRRGPRARTSLRTLRRISGSRTR